MQVKPFSSCSCRPDQFGWNTVIAAERQWSCLESLWYVDASRFTTSVATRFTTNYSGSIERAGGVSISCCAGCNSGNSTSAASYNYRSRRNPDSRLHH